MLIRLPIAFTTLQSSPLDVGGTGYVYPEALTRNSGGAASWMMKTDIVSGEQVEMAVGLGVVDLERLAKFYNEDRFSFPWERAFLRFYSPVVIRADLNPTVVVTPVIRPLGNGAGRGTILRRHPSEGTSLTRTRQQSLTPNWLMADDENEWEVPGALGAGDVDVYATRKYPLVGVGVSEATEFEFDITDFLDGILDGSYTGIRVSLEYSESAVASILDGATGDDASIEPLEFVNSTAANAIPYPYVEIQSEEVELDRSSSFDVESVNKIGINFMRSGRPDLPSQLIGYGGQVRGYLVVRIKCLYRDFLVELNNDPYNPPPIATTDPSRGRVEVETGIATELLDRRLVDLIGLVVEPESPEPDYDDEGFYAWFNSDGNAEYRRDRDLVRMIGDTTLRDALQANDPRGRFTAQLSLQMILDDGRQIGERRLFVSNYDPFGAEVSSLQSDVYPRLSVIAFKNRMNRAQAPVRVQVFVDGRPPIEMANSSFRRTLNERVSLLYTDLAWGVVVGSAYGPIRWFVRPSDATRVSHDGSYHYFWFDPSTLPVGTWRFEFVRLDTEDVVRQINPTKFTIG